MSTAGLIGHLAVEMGMISRDQLRRATRAQGRQPGKRLGELLIDLGYIDEGQLGALLAAQARRSDSARPPRRDTPPPVKRNVPDGVKLAAIALKRVTAGQFASDPTPNPDEPRRKEGTEARGWLLGLLTDAVSTGASDVLVIPNEPVRLRRFGRVHDFTTGPVSAGGTKKLLMQALDGDDAARLERTGHVSVMFEAPSVGRFRLQVHQELGGLGGTFHRAQVGDMQASLRDLGIPNAIAAVTNHPHGMVLVTGPAGSGRTTTMNALVNLICEERNDHIVIIEEPRELLPIKTDGVITQLELGKHCKSMRDAITAAPRMDADVVCVDELAPDAVDAALHAADTDQLVFATMHAPSAARALEILIDSYPHRDRRVAAGLVADSVRAVLCQRLVPALNREGTEEVGVVLALEVVLLDDELRELIRSLGLTRISPYVQSGRSRGSVLLDDALTALVATGGVTVDAARSVARHPAKFSRSRERG